MGRGRWECTEIWREKGDSCCEVCLLDFAAKAGGTCGERAAGWVWVAAVRYQRRCCRICKEILPRAGDSCFDVYLLDFVGRAGGSCGVGAARWVWVAAVERER